MAGNNKELKAGIERELVSRREVRLAIRYLDPDFQRQKLIHSLLKALLAVAVTFFLIGVLFYFRAR